LVLLSILYGTNYKVIPQNDLENINGGWVGAAIAGAVLGAGVGAQIGMYSPI